jgi:aspartokinase
MFHHRTYVSTCWKDVISCLSGSMLPLIATNVPMVIRKTSHPLGPATEISSHGHGLDAFKSGTESRPTCVTSLEKMCLLEVKSNRLEQPGHLAGRVLSCLELAHVEVYLSNESAHGQSISVLVQSGQAQTAENALDVSACLK